MNVTLDPHAQAALLDMLENIAVALETNRDPQEVAKQIRRFIAKTEAALSPKSVQCPHCKWGFFPSVIEQHIREKHSGL
jgi:hypothetical protein